jgi:PIN domain nuclease of toxin-antitoxin system
MLNLDTHILIFALIDKLRPAEKALLSTSKWGVSGIVFWEISKLFQLGRIEVDLDDPAVQHVLAALHVWPVDFNVCRKLRLLDFRGDPADEIIAATSLAYNVPLVTRDALIRKSKLVPMAL